MTTLSLSTADTTLLPFNYHYSTKRERQLRRTNCRGVVTGTIWENPCNLNYGYTLCLGGWPVYNHCGLFSITPPTSTCTVSTGTNTLEYKIDALTPDMIWFVLLSSVWAAGWTDDFGCWLSFSFLSLSFSPPVYRCCPLSTVLLPDH